MATINEICAKLATLSGLGAVGTTIFPGFMPATPDEVCTVYEYSGAPSIFQFGTPGVDIEFPAIQVVFRGKAPKPGVTNAYGGPRAKAETAYRGLSAVEVATLSSGSGGTQALYHFIRPNGPPFLIGRDELERALIAINFIAEKEPSEAVP